MNKNDLKNILNDYNISTINNYQEIDSSINNDYRLNIIVDKKYVVRISSSHITEERLQSINRLVDRYNAIGILAPKLIINKDGHYLSFIDDKVCFISEYLDYPTLDSIKDEATYNIIKKEVLKSIGLFSNKYTNIDLSDINSMWSIIDLAPLDNDIDEKQENTNLLVSTLIKYNENKLAEKIINFNNQIRERIKKEYRLLPRCVIQGDLNDTNILVSNNHFIGLIDFNMAGSEVNINHFCCETNYLFDENEFNTLSSDKLYEKVITQQNQSLSIIFNEYELNDLEHKYIEDYRSLVMLSQYPNVMAYIYYLENNKEKIIEYLNILVSR